MDFLKVESLDSARKKLFDKVGHWFASTEVISVDDSLNRIATEDVFTPEDVPGFRRSTVDGFAVLSGDAAACGEGIPAFLTLKGQVEIGLPSLFSLISGECAEVPTGGMIPDGTDAVVMCEHAEAFGEDGVAISRSVAHGENVVLPGEDAKKGTLLLRRGKKIMPQDIGALAAAGVTSVSVFVPPKVTIISTGDELVPPKKTPRLGQVRDVNSYAISALARKHGFEVLGSSVLPDDEVALEQAIREAMEVSNIVMVSGGSSKGKGDFTRPVFDRLATPGVFTHGIAVKPGKPTILGFDESSRTLLIGLPGHPVSAMVAFELLPGWLLREVTGCEPAFAVPARLASNVAASQGKLTCFPCRLIRTGDEYIAQPVYGKSGLITTLSNADGYFLIPRNLEGLPEGQVVMVEMFY